MQAEVKSEVDGLDWTAIFEPAKPVESKYEIVCTCGSSSCEHAKRFRCTCKCHHANHGAAIKSQLKKLDECFENGDGRESC